jgi:predicted CoA-binding protein
MCKIDDNMDKTLYKEILEDDQDRTIDFAAKEFGLQRDQMVFQHDNDPKHTSNLVKEYLQDQEYQVSGVVTTITRLESNRKHVAVAQN